MTILIYEVDKTYGIVCYSPNKDIIQFPYTLLHILNTTRDTTLKIFETYIGEMTKIDNRDLSNINMVKLDEVLGTLGVGGKVIKLKGLIDGFC